MTTKPRKRKEKKTTREKKKGKDKSTKDKQSVKHAFCFGIEIRRAWRQFLGLLVGGSGGQKFPPFFT
jgi:hypothetical protein